MFLKKARDEGKKTQEIIEELVLRYISPETHPNIGVKAGTTGEASQPPRKRNLRIQHSRCLPKPAIKLKQGISLAFGGKKEMSSILEQTFAAHDQAIAPGGERVPILGHLVWYSVTET
jgi:hypothetical protein